MKRKILMTISLLLLSSAICQGTTIQELFNDQDYDEIVGLLKDTPSDKLSADSLFYLGYSYLMRGDIKKAKKYLKESLARSNNVKAAEVLIAIYFGEGNYKKAVKLGDRFKDKLSDKGLFYYGLALIKLGRDDLAEDVSQQIKSKKLKNSLQKAIDETRKVHLFARIGEFYDSNIYLLPIDFPSIPDFSNTGYVTEGLLFITKGFSYLKTDITFYERYQDNRDNSNLDFFMGMARLHIRCKDAFILLPEVKYLNLGESDYSRSIAGGIEYKGLTLKGGYEDNQKDNDKDNYFVTISASNKKFLLFTGGKFYKGYPDKVFINWKLNLDFPVSSDITATLSPEIGANGYDDGTNALQVSTEAGIKWQISKNIAFIARYKWKRNYADDKGKDLEKSYIKQTAGVFTEITF